MAVYLDVRTAVLTVEQALVDALSLAYQARHPAVADLATLQAVPSVPEPGSGTGDKIPFNALRFVTSEGVVYRWRKFSTNIEALPYVVTPTDRQSAARGRWERCNSTVTYGPAYFRPVHRRATGYAKAVQLWAGDEGHDEARNRIYGQSPAFLVRYTGDQLTMAANNPRGLNQVDMPFEIWAFSRNYRAEWESLEGSPITSENTAEPGLFRMLGDIGYLLADATLGLSPGVRYVDIQGSATIEEEDLREGRFCGVVPITVKASYNIPDEDLVPLSEVWVQFKDAHLAGDVADPSNVVLSGYRLNFGAGSGLNATPTAGVAYVGGKLVSSQPGAHLFTASRDTYRFLSPDGSLYYAEVPNGTDTLQRPVGPSGSLLIGATVTDASDVVWDALLCDYLNDEGDEFRAV